MYRLHLQRNLRSLIFLAIALVVMALPVGLWWVNRTGLPESWRTAIQSKLAESGVHVEIGSLSYAPLRGVVAENVRFFEDRNRKHLISRVERVILGFDKTKLARGKMEVTRMRLQNALLMLPADLESDATEILEVRRLNGTVLMNPGRRFEMKHMTGWVQGIEVEINARIIGSKPSETAQGKTSNSRKRRKVLAHLLEQLAGWNFDPESPPRLQFWIEGDFSTPSSIESRAVLEMERIERNGAALQDVFCEFEAKDSVITLKQFRARDGMGEVSGRVDYELEEKSGRFDGTSTVDFFVLLDSWFGIKRPNQVLVGGTRKVDAQGSFRMTESGSFAVETMGRIECGSVMLKGILFEELESQFSWRNGSLYLRDLRLVRQDGEAIGKVMVEWPQVRLALHSSIPAAVYQPLFVNQPLEKVIADFSAREGAECLVDLEGGFDATDRFSWAYSGSVALKAMDFRGVPLTHVSCDLALSGKELDFTNGLIGFDYWKYPMRVAYNGPKSAEAKIERVRYVAEDKMVEFEGVTGEFWAAPLVRLFAAKTADGIENYRFHQPPLLAGSGVVDVTPQGRTKLTVDFRSSGGVTTELLGKDVILSQPRGKVEVRDKDVIVSGLKGSLFDGPIQAQIHAKPGGRVEIEADWTKLYLPAIAETYGLGLKSGGTITGRIEMDVTGGKARTVNGKGLLAVENTELFSVPMFGPLSTVISGVLNDKKAGYEQASDAFCTFAIEEGVMETRDFNTSTRSLNFAGDAKVDLAEQTMDMTMRMNARGLLGFLTIPLRPFYGMFQFRGTGPVREPKWENVMFTTPPPEQAAALNQAPKARVVEP